MASKKQRFSPPVITIDPMPPQQGQRMRITYTGARGTVLTIEWDPAGVPTSVTIPASGVVHVVVPANATSVWISDPTGGANSVQSVVAP